MTNGPSPPDIGYGKVGAAGIAGAIAIIVIWIIKTPLHQDVSPELAAAIQTVFTAVVVYLTPHKFG